MSELSTTLTEPQVQDFTPNRLDDEPTREAQPAKEPVPEKETRLDAIKRAAADVQGKVEPKEPEAKPEAKAEPKDAPAKEEVKPEGEEKPAEAAKVEERPRRQAIEAPEKFLPRAKELWQNVPHEVRSEFQRLDQERETELAQARESVKEYEAIKPYSEMARQSGTTIDVALGKYVAMEQALRSSPAQGFRELLSNMQMTPVQAIGHVLAAFNVRPEQLAYHIAENPSDYTPLARPQVQQQPQQNGEVEQLKQQLASLQQNVQHSQIHMTVIEPFARENPRYYELEPVIAQFLSSDIVPKTLSPSDRLAAAYDMAVRISPSSKSAPASVPEVGDEPDSRAGKDFGGTKSVRGAPASGVDTTNRRKGKMSRGDAISAAMSDLGLAH